MTKIVWSPANGYHEIGVENGVLYLEDGSGVAWNGLVSVDEAEVSSVESTSYYDGNKNSISQEAGDFELSLSAFTYPPEFEKFDGYNISANQPRIPFGLSYKTKHGDGYKIHLVYNAIANPSPKHINTLSTTIDPNLFVWQLSSTPAKILYNKPSSHLVVDTTTARYPEPVEILESIIYGTDFVEPRLPQPDEIVDLFEDYTVMRITYNGDGTWTATGPDDMVRLVDEDNFEITADSALWFNEDSWVVSSY